ncbi:acetate--CoA ligase family protein [Polymorphobacter sp.]|uniref:acetate--CoA ligase family protein n=1 Tax=Polymorphobacter sp. TaxID=1909290 RepID=UPI003F6EB709
MADTLDCRMIERLLRPRSIAVVGASDKPGALGASVLGNLDRSGFDGDIFLINPNRDQIGSRACLPSVASLPFGVDVAVLAIPRAGVLDAMRGLLGRKVGAAIIFAAGFAEEGPAGAADQAELARIAATSGMVIEGPNCLGMVNHIDGVPLTFVETRIVSPDGRRAVAIVSQSGAMAAVLGTTLQARDVALSLSISTGNEAASGVEDYVDWLVDEPHTHVIAMIVEQFRRPQRFLAAARRAHAAGKQIVLLHPGTSSAARASAATHTGAMAGDYRLMRAQVERTGVVFAETLEELGDIAEILVRCVPLAEPSLAVLGESGAFKALTLDLAETLRLPLTVLDDANAPALRAVLPPFVPVSNPLDITAQGLSQPQIYTDTLRALIEDDRIGAIITGIIQGDPVTSQIKIPPILAAIEAKVINKPLIFAGLDEGADIQAAHVTALRVAGIPWFPSSERAFRAMARLCRLAQTDLTDNAPAPTPLPSLGRQSGVIPEYRAKQLLAPLGIAFPEGRFARSREGALAAADVLGFPLAMKAQAAALSHKSDAGGVILNLSSRDAVDRAWTQLHANIHAHDPSLALDGVLVEKMGRRGVEMIVGARNDPDWGPVVLAGFGGVTAEILQDVCLITPDLGEKAIIARLMTLQSAALLNGYRGAPALDVPALARLIGRIGALLLAEPRLRELDLNPVILHPEGEGAVALDALMLVDQPMPEVRS